VSTSGEYDRYYEALEIPSGSPMSEVNRAYSRLRELYSGESIVVSPIEMDFPEDKRAEILRQIDEAYEKLKAMLTHPGRDERTGSVSSVSADMHDEDIGGMGYTGDVLRRIREKLRVDLHDIELATRVSSQHLESIELENFGSLPEAVFVQGYVRAYARYLLLDADRVAGDYMNRHEDWRKSSGMGDMGEADS
jgi:hypothetical protein